MPDLGCRQDADALSDVQGPRYKFSAFVPFSSEIGERSREDGPRKDFCCYCFSVSVSVSVSVFTLINY